MESVLQKSKIQGQPSPNAFEGNLYICSQDYRIVYVNERMVQQIGYDPTGELCYKALHSRDFICPGCPNNRVFNGKTARWEAYSPRDSPRHYVVNTPITQADGGCTYKRSMSMDLTEFKQEIAQRKQVEEALKEKKRDLVKRYKELNCLYGISGLLQWPDLSFEETFQGIVELIPAAWQHSEVACARTIIEDREFKTENFTETVWKLAGDIIVCGKQIGALQVCYLEKRPQSDEGPFLREEKRLIKAIAERLGSVAERLWAMEELRSSEQRYRLLSENMSEAVLVVQGAKIVFANENFVCMFGYPSSGEVVGKDLGCLHSPDLQIQLAMEDAKIESGSSNKCVFQARCTSLDGRNFWVETRYNLIRWEGKPAILATLRDVTESKLQQIVFLKEKERLVEENINLKSAMKDRFRFDSIVGKSPGIQKVYDFIIRASVSEANVVIEGESGTGKELVALTIHKMSRRSDKPFVPVNCGAIPEPLFESEFFGYRKGAFTGAFIDKPGLFDLGNGGTLFLDEVGELSLNMQVKLLRAIEGKGYTPVGDNKVKQSDVRIIATSNRDLVDMVKKGTMRRDFFFRINIIAIQIPPLRNRKEDIPLLIDDYLQLYNGSKMATSIPGEIMTALYNYRWPGNVRELQNVLLRYLTMGRLDFIDPGQKGRPVEAGSIPAIDFKQGNINLQTAVENIEKSLILKALDQTNWNRSRAAELLGISRRALFRKTQKFDMK